MSRISMSTTKFQFTKFGLKHDPRGAHVLMTYQGKDLLGVVKAQLSRHEGRPHHEGYRSARVRRPVLRVTAQQESSAVRTREIKVGDRVVCIDDTASFRRLQKGHEYTVEAAYNGEPTVIVNGAYHCLERFELVSSSCRCAL